MSEPNQSLPPGATGAGQPVVYLQPMTPLRAMAITAAVIFVLVLAYVLYQIRDILILLILGVLLGAAVDPLVAGMRRRGLSRGQAILLIYGAIFATLAIGLYFVVPPLIDEGQRLVAGVPGYLDQAEAWVTSNPNPAIRDAGERALTRGRALIANLQQNPPIQVEQLNQAIGFLTSIFGILFTTVSTLIVAYYWMTEKGLIKRVVLGIFPIARRDTAHRMWDEIEFRLGGWARGQLVLMAVVGLISAIAYFALGLPFWFLLAIWAGLTEVIPIVGPFLGGALAVLVALTDSWQKAVVVAVFVFLLQQLEGSILVPRIMRNAVGLTPLTVILAVLIGGALGGILGALLAIPVAAAVQVLATELLRAREEAVDSGGEPAVAVSVATVRVEDATEGTMAGAGTTAPGAQTGDAGLPVVSIAPATVREGEIPRSGG